ncbi:MAG: Diguanylate cyclase, partial [Klenkia sp.]|nr:Diguanylate cyclase [Klenkia sp.]
MLLAGVLALPTADRRLAAAALVSVVAVLTGLLLLRTGRSGVSRRWRTLGAAPVVGLVAAALAELVADGTGQLDAWRTAASVPAHLVGAVGVLVLLGDGRLRAGGARLLTEIALFCTAAFVLGQVLVVAPLAPVLDTPSR